MNSTTGLSSDATAGGDRSERVSDAVIEEVAAVRGVDPLDLEPLYSVVDPDALDALFRRTGGSASASPTVHFTMAGCEVLVHGDGAVAVIPPLSLDDSPTRLAPSGD